MQKRMHLRRIQTLNRAASATPSTAPSVKQPEPILRACHRHYLGTSNAQRMLKRAQLAQKSFPSDDPIFALREEAITHDAHAAAAAPFDEPTSPLKSSSSTVTTGYSVQCYSSHSENEQKVKDYKVLEREMRVLLTSINSSRLVEGAKPLCLLPDLCQLAQEHADSLYLDECTNIASPIYIPNVTIATSCSGRRRATLISPPRIGALACAEMWYGGKYRQHLYPYRAAHEDGGHADDCPCHLKMAFDTITDPGFAVIGVGRGGYGGKGRLVVELGEH